MKNIAIGTIAFAFLVLGFWSVVSQYRAISDCRNLDLNQVKAVRITKMTDEISLIGATVLFDDSNKIKEGLQTLKNAGNFSRRKINASREKFTLGYQIQLILTTDSIGPTIYYFYQNDSFNKLNVVITHCTVPSDEIQSTDGIYTSTAFGEWIDKNIEPQFKDIQ